MGLMFKRDALNHFVHPSEEISIPEQLIGRNTELLKLRDCFETDGAHAFVWGARGVGKTSLVHTACSEFDETVRLAAAIGCQKNSTHHDLLKDIWRRVSNSGHVHLSDPKIRGKLNLFGIASVEGEKRWIPRAIANRHCQSWF